MTSDDTATRTAPDADTAAPLAAGVRQLGPRGIAGVWAAAALPMGACAWILAPWLAGRLTGPGALARAMIAALTVGLLWQSVLVLLLVRREQGSVRWHVLRDALWLHPPTGSAGRRGGRLWLVVLPLVALAAAKDLVPKLPHPAGLDFFAALGTPEGRGMFAGAWGWFAVLVVMCVGNTVVGEEVLFRGYLLPRMGGVFGRLDWVANGVIFALYHLHRWWAIPGLLAGVVTYAWPTRRYRSALVGIVVHSAQSVATIVLVLPLVLGL